MEKAEWLSEKDHPCSVTNDLGLTVAGFEHCAFVFFETLAFDFVEFVEIMASVFIFSFHYISALDYMKSGNGKGIYSEI